MLNIILIQILLFEYTIFDFKIIYLLDLLDLLDLLLKIHRQNTFICLMTW